VFYSLSPLLIVAPIDPGEIVNSL